MINKIINLSHVTYSEVLKEVGLLFYEVYRNYFFEIVD
jgi:hypothetical protein